MVTFNNIESKWLQEIIDNRPQGKILLVGTKSDLRRKPGERQSRLSQRSMSTRQKEVRKLFNHILSKFHNVMSVNLQKVQ